ncbi:VOC family protein [Pseudonocardia sp. C8]|uniref:VOC family protein n=1 Tax=Pseudonocardia sp. C8 TaxID=2762759 RepID=UPI00164361BA|nr:VOC family protein [Pseudonocardia sp. C8]MBC3190408.1 VOC family protein [Pseudonocardia sp. C8]
MDSLEITISAVDGERAVEFWCDALGYRVAYRRDRYHVLEPRGGAGPRVVIQTVDAAAAVPGNVHLDLRVDHPEDTVARLVARGARVQGEVTEAGRTWTVLLDPEGNELCVCPARSA